MSETQTQEAQEQPKPEQQPETKPRPKDLPEDQEWNHVEFSEQQQRRFNRVYAEMKEKDRIIEKIAQDNRKLLERFEGLESAQKEEAVSKRVSELRAAEKAALEEGNYEQASSVRDQITDLKVEAKMPKAAPREEPEEPAPDKNDWLEKHGAQINSWVNERDDKGNLKRPWADPGHADHKTALLAAKTVMEDNPDRPIDEVLEMIDKINGRVMKKDVAPVLSGSGDVRPREKKAGLTVDEKKIAAAMGVSEERYAAMQKKLAGGSKYAAGT